MTLSGPILSTLKFSSLLLLPGFFWLYFFAGEKSLFRFPSKALLPVFALGVCVSIPAIAIEYFCISVHQVVETTTTTLITSFFIIAPVEEYLKSLAVDIAGYQSGEKQGPPQVMAWYFASAIGFASIENVLYCQMFGARVFLYRLLLTTLAHIACSGLIALFMEWNPERKTFGFLAGFFSRHLHSRGL